LGFAKPERSQGGWKVMIRRRLKIRGVIVGVICIAYPMVAAVKRN
jgi:hypothetical protein